MPGARRWMNGSVSLCYAERNSQRSSPCQPGALNGRARGARRVATTIPATMTRRPRAAAAPGPRRAARSRAAPSRPAARSARSTSATAGRRGSASAISSQPSTCDVSASVTSQPCAGQLGARSSSPSSAPATIATSVAMSVAANSGPAGRRRSRPMSRRTRMKPVYATPVSTPNSAPRAGSSPNGVVADDAGDQDRAAEHERHGERDARRRALAEQQPRRDGDEHDLQVGEHGRQAGADVGDRVVPEDEVGGEERAGGGRAPPAAGRRRAVAAALGAARARRARAARRRSERRRRSTG